MTDARLPVGSDLALLLDAARAVITGKVRTVSGLQRRIRVGFAKAGHLALLLEQEGIIAGDGKGTWECLVPPDGLDSALDRIREASRG